MNQDVTRNLNSQVQGLSMEEYHNDDALGSSDIKWALQSLAKFKAAVIDKRLEKEESTKFEIGTAAHSVILEQTTDGFVCGPDVDKRNKEWTSFVAKNPGKIILSPKHHSAVLEMFESFSSHSVAHRFVSASKVEESFFTVDHETGLQIKARPDGYFIEDGGVWIWDYKTAKSAKAREFEKSIVNYGFHIQAAHYIDVVSQVLKMPVKGFYWIAQEKEAPYDLSIFQADRRCLELGEKTRRSLLNQIAVAIRTSEFPGYDQNPQSISLPSWVRDDDEPFLFESEAV